MAEAEAPAEPLTDGSGELEILLVEARRLCLPEGQGFMSALLRSVVCLTSRQQAAPVQQRPTFPVLRTVPEASKLSTVVNFHARLTHGEVLEVAGSKEQTSTIVAGTDSPSWAATAAVADGTDHGGFLFRTGPVSAQQLSELLMELEFMDTAGGTTPQRVGLVRLMAVGEPSLVDPQHPVRLLWLPLLSQGVDGRPSWSKSGEVLLMTLWRPASAVGDAEPRPTVRSMFLATLGPATAASRVREPVSDSEARHLHYNPNLLQLGGRPESPAEFHQRHIEALHIAASHAECLARRQERFWGQFLERLRAAGVPSGDLAGLRLKWIQDGDQQRLDELGQLVQHGIPPRRREQLWLEVTMALREMCQGAVPESLEAAREGAETVYKESLGRGLPQHSDANAQLQADFYILSAWESSTPPDHVLLDAHLARLSRAKNVCTALLASPESGAVYCESLLVLAFFLLLPMERLPPRPAGTSAEAHPHAGGTGATRAVGSLSEASAYWLLRTLIGSRSNGAFSEYYGRPLQPSNAAVKARGESGQPAPEPLCAGSGAMQDVLLLECCVAHYDLQLWHKLNSSGFQLASVFYGAFMRLYCTYLPTLSVYRLWDLLLAHTTDPRLQPHSRAHLVDLAFAVLRPCKPQILACRGALEVQDVILGALGSLYDPNTVVELVLDAHQVLWGATGFESSKVARACHHRDDIFAPTNQIFADQNEVLRYFTRDRNLGGIPFTQYEAAPNSRGVTTKELLKDVIPTLHHGLESHPRGDADQKSARTWAMHRPLPLAARALCEDVLQQSWAVGTPKMQFCKVLVPPFGVRDGLEPLRFRKGELVKVLQTNMPNWRPKGGQLYDLFTDRPVILPGATRVDLPQLEREGGLMCSSVRGLLGCDKNGPAGAAGSSTVDEEDTSEGPRVSVNELLLALIICSKGTVMEKAAALFTVYSSADPFVREDQANHLAMLSPLSRNFKEPGDAGHWNVLAPEENAEKESALHFKVMSNHPQEGTLIGEVFIPTLADYVGWSITDAQMATLNIWGQLVDELSASATDPPPKVTVGEMEVAIMWMPRTPQLPRKGQFCIRLQAIRFNAQRVPLVAHVDPYVEVYSNAVKRGNQLRRWDPRTKKVVGFVKFEATGASGLASSAAHYTPRRDEDPGWDPSTGKWVWDRRCGEQWSDEVELRSGAVSVSSRKNVLSMTGVRFIVASILHRALISMTNRQAILLADAAFNRQGAVPGILEALLAEARPGDPEPAVPRTSKEGFGPSLDVLKTEWATSGRRSVDVTDKLAVEHERQVQCTGRLNLFTAAFLANYPQGFNLKDMGVRNGFRRDQVLWVRYVRGGDGERCTQGIQFDGTGKLKADDSTLPEINLDLLESWPEEKDASSEVTKTEFVACLLNNTLLAESLRRIGAASHLPHPKKAIPLQVLILDADPVEEQLMELFVGRGGGAGSARSSPAACSDSTTMTQFATSTSRAKKLHFYEQPPQKSPAPEGANHRVEVFLGDSIHEFKAKLTMACNREADFWDGKRATSSHTGRKYRDIAIDHRHLVMVFVPTPRLNRLAAQKQVDSLEYKYAQHQAVMDPSSWEPLDVHRTFSQCPQHGFGRIPPPKICVIEGSETYKLANTRYQEFHRRMLRLQCADINEPSRCFGFAKYLHKVDAASTKSSAGSCEWRPAMIRARRDPLGQQKYAVEWLLKPRKQSATNGVEDRSSTREAYDDIDKENTLFSHRDALVDSAFARAVS